MADQGRHRGVVAEYLCVILDSDAKTMLLAAAQDAGQSRNLFFPTYPTGVRYEVRTSQCDHDPPARRRRSWALHDVLADPALKKRALDLGIDAHASTPAELDARMRSDIAKWGGVIARAHIPKQ